MVDQIMAQVQGLSLEEQLRLIQLIAQNVARSLQGPRLSGPGLVYGEFHGPNLSTEKDFGLSELVTPKAGLSDGP